MEIKNHKILLTVIDRGRLSTPVSNVSSKVLRSKIMTSSFEERVIDKNGYPTGSYITPKNHFKASNDYIERSEIVCTRKLTIPENIVDYFISKGSCPHTIKNTKWEKMSEEERLKVHLGLNAEGKEFSYELI